jgi:hypothetical protein
MARNFVLKMPLKRLLKLPFFVICLLFFSCEDESPVQFYVSENTAALLGNSRAAREGILDFSKQKKYEYRFDESFSVPANASMEIEFEITKKPAGEDRCSLTLDMGQFSWQIPVNFNDGGVRYFVPVHDSFDGRFNISAEENNAVVISIVSIDFTDRWFGYIRIPDGFDLRTPFVTANKDGSYKIDVPPSFISNGYFPEIQAVFSYEKTAVMEFSGKILETYTENKMISVPASYFERERVAFPKETLLYADDVSTFILKPSAPPVFPEPIKADPAFVLNWKNWRNKNYEVFRWDRFPSILIFDFADYDIQDKMLKRLAFFVEKTGFRGRLAPDSEIKDLHAWNAHDYRARDLAAFFDAAKKANFPLSAEEKELEKILLNEKIIRESSASGTAGYTEGVGGIISISRESADYLRRTFMTHEAFHGIFFIDEDFRNFSRARWDKLPAAAKKFIISYFEFQQYDIKDEYLLINEFMAHVLQQSVSGAADYFGRNLPLRLESTWRASALPKKDEASGTWPILAAAFTAEAEAFSAYVNRRWGLAAGRVWGLQIWNK